MLVIGDDTVTSDIGRIVQDSVQLFSSQFKNLESIEWDLDAEPSLQRYRLSELFLGTKRHNALLRRHV